MTKQESNAKNLDALALQWRKTFLPHIIDAL